MEDKVFDGKVKLYHVFKKFDKDGDGYMSYEDFENCLLQYRNVKTITWCQEEPMNQGAWYAIQHHLRRVMKRDAPGLPLQYAGRTAFAAPAVGYASVHIEQQQKLVQSALVGETSDDEDSGK